MKYLILIITQAISIHGIAQPYELTGKAKELRGIHNNILAATNDLEKEKFELAFFHAFPNDFKTFEYLYGYTDKRGPLYSDGFNHVEQLISTPKVSDTAMAKKLISLCIGGKWQADGISFMKYSVIRAYTGDFKLYSYVLNNLGNETAKSFWHFINDGLHPDKQFQTNRKLLELEDADRNQYNIMMEQYKLVLQEHKEQGR